MGDTNTNSTTDALPRNSNSNDDIVLTPAKSKSMDESFLSVNESSDIISGSSSESSEGMDDYKTPNTSMAQCLSNHSDSDSDSDISYDGNDGEGGDSNEDSGKDEIVPLQHFNYDNNSHPNNHNHNNDSASPSNDDNRTQSSNELELELDSLTCESPNPNIYDPVSISILSHSNTTTNTNTNNNNRTRTPSSSSAIDKEYNYNTTHSHLTVSPLQDPDDDNYYHEDIECIKVLSRSVSSELSSQQSFKPSPIQSQQQSHQINHQLSHHSHQQHQLVSSKRPSSMLVTTTLQEEAASINTNVTFLFLEPEGNLKPIRDLIRNTVLRHLHPPTTTTTTTTTTNTRDDERASPSTGPTLSTAFSDTTTTATADTTGRNGGGRILAEYSISTDVISETNMIDGHYFKLAKYALDYTPEELVREIERVCSDDDDCNNKNNKKKGKKKSSKGGTSHGKKNATNETVSFRRAFHEDPNVLLAQKRIMNAKSALEVLECTPKELEDAWREAERSDEEEDEEDEDDGGTMERRSSTRRRRRVWNFGNGLYCAHLPTSTTSANNSNNNNSNSNSNGRDEDDDKKEESQSNGNDGGIYVINGFYLALRERFLSPQKQQQQQQQRPVSSDIPSDLVDPDMSVYAFVVSWDVSTLTWKDFQTRVVGSSADPSAAAEGSIRRTLHDEYRSLGLRSRPDRGRRIVHSSESPLEGLIERTNWLSRDDVGDDEYGRILLRRGVPESAVRNWGKDVTVRVPGRRKMGGGDGGGAYRDSVYDVVKGMDTPECTKMLVSIYDGDLFGMYDADVGTCNAKCNCIVS